MLYRPVDSVAFQICDHIFKTTSDGKTEENVNGKMGVGEGFMARTLDTSVVEKQMTHHWIAEACAFQMM